MGTLTTHILDTSNGTPARGIAIRLYRCTASDRELLGAVVSNDDGRCDAPLLDGADFAPGTYELVFAVADYFRDTKSVTSEPPFLDDITLRFTMSDDSHYHVPLLVSPWSYSTYRGS